MAPSPENDEHLKAPDKQKNEKDKANEATRDEKTLSNLNDGELKALLDEAITYKNPKDREGKSKLFKDLLIQAEESERIARAASAGGSELVRHCNPSARRHHQRRGAAGAGAAPGSSRRQPSSASVSEAALHGGSLDNLAKEELYGPSVGHRGSARKTVSARMREGGSLPCNVNSSMTPARDYQFLEEAKRSRAMKNKEYTAIDMETESLLENDHLAQSYQEQEKEREMTQTCPKYTARASFQVTSSGVVPTAVASANVDDGIQFPIDDNASEMRSGDVASIENKVIKSQYNVYIQKCSNREPEEKKTDENGNAVHQAKSKKKKQVDKNVVVIPAENVEGHKSEIINDVNKLMQYIEGTDSLPPGKNKSNIQKSKQLHKQHNSEDGGRSKKQRTQSSKGKEPRVELKKSNSLSEISTTKLDVFAFATGSEEQDKSEKVVMRTNKPQNDRPRERRSWGTVEAPSSFQTLYANASVENLETTDNWVVTKTKKKSKKRRSSVGASRRPTASSETGGIRTHSGRAPSPDLRGQQAFSMPHSERSNDSSDADSVHSLPIDGPISYADIAKNSEKKEKKISPEKEKIVSVPIKDRIQLKPIEIEPKNDVTTVNNVKPIPPPDVHNIKSFPAIASTVNKVVVEKAKVTNNKKPGRILKAKDKIGMSEKSVGVGQYNDVSVSSDLAIIRASDSMGLSGQTLPPDVPDVSTIEKMHFLNRLPVAGPVVMHAQCCPGLQQGPPHIQQHFIQQQTQTQPQQQHVAYEQQPQPQKLPSPPKNSSPPIHNQIPDDKDNKESKKQSPEPKRMNSESKKSSPEPQNNGKANFVENSKKKEVNDVNKVRKIFSEPQQNAESQQFQFDVVSNKTVDSYGSPDQQTPVSPDAPTSCDSERTLSCDEGDEGSPMSNLESSDPPPVVILSGSAGKSSDVPGLVFGFDINEQLLRDEENETTDICGSFVARFVPPDVFNRTSHNHDKIVNFIGMAWESIVNGNVEYYSEDL